MTNLRTIKVKVCGMTRVQDVAAAVALGVDAIGVILHADSPRQITVEQAQELRTLTPAFVTMVGVFVNADAETVNTLSQQIGLDLIQLHGEESSQLARQLSTPYIKAIRAKSADQVSRELSQYPDARAILLDPYVEGQHGGTGKQLDAALWQASSDKKMILAGGLSPDNILQAVTNLSPYAVDLNSGVEINPGIKDKQLIKAVLTTLGR